MGRLMCVATCSLNQWVLDWEGNLARIVESIRIAKSKGAKLRVGPELEITGYGCLDHFLESDVYLHSMEMLKRILEDPSLGDIVIDLYVSPMEGPACLCTTYLLQHAMRLAACNLLWLRSCEVQTPLV